MLFQTLDEKNECVAIFQDGDLIWKEIPDNLTKTWKYSAFLEDLDGVSYANLYLGGKTLSNVCPEELKEEWEKINSKLKAFYRSFVEGKINLSENCFFELVPHKFLLEYCDIKNKITEHVFDNYKKPENYDFLLNLIKLSTKIKYQKLNIDLSAIRAQLSQYKTRQFAKKIAKISPYIKYDIFGTKTGRLTTEKNSFPLLTMDKNYRSIIKPQNDWFVELDYNAAELRMLLSLSGKEQPREDIHDWNVENIYRGKLTREQAKKRIFSWLYNPNSNDFLSSRAYDRGSVKNRYWDGKCVNTAYNRHIESDEFHALNYIIQSTLSDMVLRQAIKLDELLKDKKTNIAFIVHDSVVLDMSSEDEHFINEIFWAFSNTDFGKFKTNVSAGKDFGDLKKLWIQS